MKIKFIAGSGTMPQTQTFYYRFEKNWFWLLSNLKQLITKKNTLLRKTACFDTFSNMATYYS